MDNVLETMQDYKDVEEALRDGFRSMGGDTLDEAELEGELNEMIREAAAEEEKIKQKEPAAEDNRVRIGKRVLDLSDLPEVPNKQPSAAGPSTSKEENGTLEERWKRLRMHAT